MNNKHIKLSSAPPPTTPKWLKLLWVFYKYIDISPVRPKQLWNIYSPRVDIEKAGIYNYDTFRIMIGWLYKVGYLYRFGEVSWMGYSYMINMSGLRKLCQHNLITKDQESYARMDVLRRLAEVDEERYRRVLARMKF